MKKKQKNTRFHLTIGTDIFFNGMLTRSFRCKLLGNYIELRDLIGIAIPDDDLHRYALSLLLRIFSWLVRIIRL